MSLSLLRDFGTPAKVKAFAIFRKKVESLLFFLNSHEQWVTYGSTFFSSNPDGSANVQNGPWKEIFPQETMRLAFSGLHPGLRFPIESLF
jgi:hypothetical protein